MDDAQGLWAGASNRRDNGAMRTCPLSPSDPEQPELRQLALEALLAPDLEQKVLLAQSLHAQAATLLIATDAHFLPTGTLPGCPARPELRSHLDVAKRSPFTVEGLAALLHAVTHIEFNAINLALDAVWRFGGMPRTYYLDWLKVAAEEARHFSLLRAELQTMGYDYGDFAAHTGLWDMTQKTDSDVLARMALVPRTLEARGLDATPPMQAKLRKVGTPGALRAVGILDIILRDEIGHVAIGNHWYRYLCDQRGLEPVATYAVLAGQYGAPRLKGPFNLQARQLAGFDAAELALLGTSA
ncbi:ferritin-like domain-containing protein [soil metagenome]